MPRVEYNYCPTCATPLDERLIHQRRRRVCDACGFVQFHDPKVAVIALVTHDDRVLLIRRGVEPEKGKWALPGGYMDAGETAESALRRELQEEVGLAITQCELMDVFPMLVPDGNDPANNALVNNGIVLAYRAQPAVGQSTAVLAQDDVERADWFAADELPRNLAFVSTRALLTAWQERVGAPEHNPTET